MRCRELLDLDPPPLARRRVVTRPAIFDCEGEQPAKHLDRLVDRGGREGAERSTERVGARPAFGETTTTILRLLELVESVGVHGPDVDLCEWPVREKWEEMPEGPIPICEGRRPDFASTLPDLRPGERPERGGILTATETAGDNSMAWRWWHPCPALDFSADHIHLFFAAPPGPALRRRAQGQVPPPTIGRESQGEDFRAAARSFEDVVFAPFSHELALPASERNHIDQYALGQ